MASITDNSTSTRIDNANLRLFGRVIFLTLLILGICTVIMRNFILYDHIINTLDVPRVAAFEAWGLSLSVVAWYRVIVRLIYAGVWIGVGSFIFSRRSGDRVGLIMATILIMIGSGISGIMFDHVIYWSQDGFVGLFIRSIDVLGFAVTVAFWGLFPDGKFEPRWMLIFLVLWIITLVLFLLPLDSPLFAFNSFGIMLISISIVMIGLLGGQYLNYRHRYSPIQRAQVRWVFLGGGLVTFVNTLFATIFTIFGTQGSNLIIFLVEIVAPIVELSWFLIPIAIAFALFRYRLWDVDIAINRSLVYGIVAGILIAMIFLIVTVAQFIFADNVNILFALVLSGIVSAALWRPLQQRVQRFVDVRIYGMRFDQNQLKAAQKPLNISNPGALTGRTLGVYQVGNLIGQGGMGEVYMAQGEGQTVAIKTIAQTMQADGNFLKRFEREAQIGISLNHPNIANVYTFDNADGMYYMVQEYLQGEDLKDWMKREGKIDLATTIEFLQDLASALDMAHVEGFVHRDIKPANIMICPNDDNETHRAVLMDFGITKIKDASTELTGTGIIGTIDYMAPEQIQSRKTIDGRADIYALAIVAYEMLTGERPFTGSLAQIVFAHMSQPAPDPREFAPDLSSETAHTLMKALEKDPDARFATAAEFVAALI